MHITNQYGQLQVHNTISGDHTTAYMYSYAYPYNFDDVNHRGGKPSLTVRSGSRCHHGMQDDHTIMGISD